MSIIIIPISQMKKLRHRKVRQLGHQLEVVEPLDLRLSDSEPRQSLITVGLHPGSYGSPQRENMQKIYPRIVVGTPVKLF